MSCKHLARLVSGLVGSILVSLLVACSSSSGVSVHRSPIAVVVHATPVYVYHGQPDMVWSISWSPDSKRVASANYNGPVEVWDATTGGHSLKVEGETNAVNAVAWSHDGTHIASTGQHGTLQIWDAATGKILHVVSGHRSIIYQIAWSPDDTALATASADHTVKVWDAATGHVIFTYTGHTNAVHALAWSPDGMRLASGGLDHTLHIWDARTGQHVLTYRAQESIDAVAWSPNGTFLAASSIDVDVHPAVAVVRVWHATLGNPLTVYRAQKGKISSISWSPDSTRLISGGDDEARVWNVATSQTVALYTPPIINGAISVAWSPDAQYLAFGGVMGIVSILRAP